MHQLGWIHAPAGVDPCTSRGGSMHQPEWIHAPVGMDPPTCIASGCLSHVQHQVPHHITTGMGWDSAGCREPKYTGVKSSDLPQRALSGWRGTPAATRKWNTTQHTHTHTTHPTHSCTSHHAAVCCELVCGASTLQPNPTCLPYYDTYVQCCKEVVLVGGAAPPLHLCHHNEH